MKSYGLVNYDYDLIYQIHSIQKIVSDRTMWDQIFFLFLAEKTSVAVGLFVRADIQTLSAAAAAVEVLIKV